MENNKEIVTCLIFVVKNGLNLETVTKLRLFKMPILFMGGIF